MIKDIDLMSKINAIFFPGSRQNQKTQGTYYIIVILHNYLVYVYFLEVDFLLLFLLLLHSYL